MPADDNRVTMRQVYDTVCEIKADLKALNGTVRQHCTDIAVLRQEVNTQKEQLAEMDNEQDSRWDKVWDVAVKPVLMTIVTAVITALVIKGAP